MTGGHVKTSLRRSLDSQALAVSLLLFSGGALAEPPAGASATPAEPPRGSFMSSLKQAFSQDFEQEVVRGHFDVGSAPDTHRYYCLVNLKSGKSEVNGVAGELVPRHDKMTGIKGASVSFFSCADAERKGLLVTAPYVLTSAVASKVTPPPAGVGSRSAPAATPAAPAAVAGTAVAAAGAAGGATEAAAAAPAAVAVAPPQTEIMAAYTRFIAGQNAHDRTMVSAVLLDSNDFVSVQYGGIAIWGYREALDAFEDAWKGTWKLDPQTEELRIATVAPGVAVLVTPLLFTRGAPGKSPSTVAIRWSGVFVKGKSGWRIASIFITPYEGWRASPAG